MRPEIIVRPDMTVEVIRAHRDLRIGQTVNIGGHRFELISIQGGIDRLAYRGNMRAIDLIETIQIEG